MREATVKNKMCFYKSDFCLLQLRLSLQQQNHQELPPREPKRWRACLHHVLESNHELPGTGDGSRRLEACTHSALRCVCVYLHALRCLLTTSCSVLLFFTQYGFNMVMSHAHAVNEIALSLNNKNSRWELRPLFPRETGLGQTMGETLQPVHSIGLYFFMRLSFSQKSEIRGAHAGCSRNVY